MWRVLGLSTYICSFTCDEGRPRSHLPRLPALTLPSFPPISKLISLHCIFYFSALHWRVKYKRFCTGHGGILRCRPNCLQAPMASLMIHWPSLHSRVTLRGSSSWSGLAFRTGTAPGLANCRWGTRSRSNLKLTLPCLWPRELCVLFAKCGTRRSVSTLVHLLQFNIKWQCMFLQ